MVSANQSIELPVHESKSGDGRIGLIRIDTPSEMDDWEEVINGPISPWGLAVITDFFGIKPKISSWIGTQMIPNTYEFLLPTGSKDVEFVFRIWQYGVGNEGIAEIDIYAHQPTYPNGFSFSSGIQKIAWIGIRYGQLLVATEHGVLYRATRQRSRIKNWLGRVWRFGKVEGFRIEMSPLQDPSNSFANLAGH